VIRRAAITYDGLPVSSGGAHKLRTRGFLAGHAALQAFAEAISLDARPFNLLIEVIEGDGVPEEFSAPLLRELGVRYPKIRVRGIGDYTGHQWEIESTSLNQVLERFERGGPVPEAGYAGPAVVIHATWNLVLFDSRTGRELSYQRRENYLGYDTSYHCYLGRSFMYSRISDKTSAHLFLSLPFEDVTADARRLAGEIQTSFPARLSSKHWKIWRITRDQDSYVGRKIGHQLVAGVRSNCRSIEETVET
jgi:hypothetical protein